MRYVLVATMVAFLGVLGPASAGDLEEITSSPDAYLNENVRDWIFRQSTEIREFGCVPIEHVAAVCDVTYWPLHMHGCTHLFDAAGTPLQTMERQYSGWWDALTFGDLQCANQQ